MKNIDNLDSFKNKIIDYASDLDTDAEWESLMAKKNPKPAEWSKTVTGLGTAGIILLLSVIGFVIHENFGEPNTSEQVITEVTKSAKEEVLEPKENKALTELSDTERQNNEFNNAEKKSVKSETTNLEATDNKTFNQSNESQSSKVITQKTELSSNELTGFENDKEAEINRLNIESVTANESKINTETVTENQVEENVNAQNNSIGDDLITVTTGEEKAAKQSVFQEKEELEKSDLVKIELSYASLKSSPLSFAGIIFLPTDDLSAIDLDWARDTTFKSKDLFYYKNYAALELLGQGGFYSLNYGRILRFRPKAKTYLQVGISYNPPDLSFVPEGTIPLLAPVSIYQSRQIRGAHHIDFGVCVTFMNDKLPEEPNDFYVLANPKLGYRNQKYGGRFFWKVEVLPIMEFGDIFIVGANNFEVTNFDLWGGVGVGWHF